MPRYIGEGEVPCRMSSKTEYTYIARDKNSDKSNSSDYQVFFSPSSKKQNLIYNIIKKEVAPVANNGKNNKTLIFKY